MSISYDGHMVNNSSIMHRFNMILLSVKKKSSRQSCGSESRFAGSWSEPGERKETGYGPTEKLFIYELFFTYSDNSFKCKWMITFYQFRSLEINSIPFLMTELAHGRVLQEQRGLLQLCLLLQLQQLPLSPYKFVHFYQHFSTYLTVWNTKSKR